MPTSILATKLHRPSTPAERVSRPRLVETLTRGLGNKLTLIAAPAGFGKTTVAVCWLAQDERPAAWVSLAGSDNDVVRFFTYAITALQRVNSRIGEHSLKLLQSATQLAIEEIIDQLINELAELDQEIILALDDYHLIEQPDIHRAMTYLLDHQPLQLHLAIISRAEPPLQIAKLRAKGQLVEIHVDDLRFTETETKILFNRHLKLGLADEQIARLERQTEGWITGLQLSSLTLKNAKDVDAFIDALSGGDRYIADYLVDEVLSQQPAAVQQFLLRTAVLDRMNADLCNALVGITNGQAMLELLERSKLFVVPLDPTRQWYRYHHLFADMLRLRLAQHHPGLVPDLYRRVFDWHVAHELLEEAIDYALKGQMYAEAAVLVEQIGYQVYWSNLAHIVGRWMRALPDEIVQSNPQLRVQQIYILIDQGKVRAVERATESLARYLNEHPDIEEEEYVILDGKLRAMQSVVLFHRYLDGEQGSELARRALEILPQECIFDREVAAIHAGGCLTLIGELAQARTLLQDVDTWSRSTASSMDRLLLLSNQGLVDLFAGSLHRAHDAFHEAHRLAQAVRIRQGSTYSNALGGLAEIYHEWNQLETALAYAQQAITVAEEDEFLDRLMLAYSGMVQLNIARHDLTGATATLQRAKCTISQYDPPPIFARWHEMLNVRIALSAGDLALASHWANNVVTDIRGHFIRQAELMTLARVHLAQGNENLAIPRLILLQALARRQERYRDFIRINTLLAGAYQLGGKEREALTALHQAMQLAEPENYVYTFVDGGEPIRALLLQLHNGAPVASKLDPISADYTGKILAAWGHTDPSLPSASGKTANRLTPRELDVLRLMATGVSDAEIARQLIISENTVRTHVKSIFNKLDVNNRTHAAFVASQQSLLAR